MGGFAEKMEDFTVFVLNPDVRNYLAAFLEDRLKQLFKCNNHCETSGLEEYTLSLYLLR